MLKLADTNSHGPPSLGDSLFRLEEEHQTFFERSPDLIARFDHEFRFIYVNPAMVESMGHPSEFYLGRRPSEIDPASGPLRQWEEGLASVARDGNEGHFEFAWSDPTGVGERFYESRLVPEHEKDGTVGTLLSVSRDVTARRAAEATARATRAYFRALIADSSDLLAAVDAEGVIRFCSDSATQLVGRYPEQVVGRNVLTLIHPDDAEHVAAAWALGQSAPGQARRVEARVRHADGGWRRFEVMGKSVELESGRTTILSARDVTERHRLQSLIQRSQRVAALGRMAGGIAHDFNNFLSTILGTCELLSQDLPDHPGLSASIGIIRDAGRSASSLTHQLLTFGRQQAVRLEPVDLGPALESMRPLLLRVLGADIEVVLSTTPGDVVEFDRGLLEQVVHNLAGLARDGMPDGGRISITSKTLAESHGTRVSGSFGVPNHSVRISIRDTGTPMDPASIAHAVDPFGPDTAHIGGNGLPLALVQSILEQCGGVFEIDSSCREGKAVEIYLPAAAMPAEAPPPPPSEPSIGAAAGWDTIGGWETILVVEDDLAVLQVTTRVLERLGYRVLPATGPTEALKAIRAHAGEIRLALCDVHLPEMAGPRLFQQLHAERPTMQALFVSGYVGEPENRQDFLPAGAAFLQKPYSVIEVGDALRRLLGGAQTSSTRHGAAGPVGRSA
jgi:two-component system, cell cycle sensor histidine kinase and response regulator CckA